ncbi:hypothetical protein SteCoe_18614 [Stentor coeruleus]|uniref:Uncharacterized protein n=1 Tax=Stentor coeruleus TaxID=5963 RepID=A0A1R2BWC8_9CILI|nr:hypothetical protein SteCoe_18614 [Stentor coeruleus]
MIDGEYAALDVWDITGQEKIRGRVALFRKKIDGLVVVYDITNIESFVSAQKWVYSWMVFEKCIPLLLVGNKKDLEDDRKVATLQGQAFANSLSMMFIEVSSKNVDEVNKAFDLLASKLVVCISDKRNNNKSSYPCIMI